MKVLLINEGAADTGVIGHGRVGDLLASGLAAQGCEIEQHVMAPPGRLARAAIARWPGNRLGVDCRLVRWNAVQSARAVRTVRHLVRTRAFDIVHVHTQALAFWAFAGVFDRLPAPLVLSADAPIRDWMRMLTATPDAVRPVVEGPAWWAERQALRRADGIVAFSDWARDGLARQAPGVATATIHPGIDLSNWPPLPQPAPSGPLRILFVGSDFARKGGYDLVRATAHLRPDRATVHIVTTSDVRELANAPGIAASQGIPTRAQLGRYYADSDVVCVPTRADTGSLVVVEALTGGRPVITSTVADLAQMVRDVGLAIPPGDPVALAAALDQVAADRQRFAARSAAAVADARERYDHLRQAARLARFFDNVVSGAHRRGPAWTR